MTLKREFKVGDRVCSFGSKKGTVVKINGHAKIAELYTVSVDWDNPLHNRVRNVNAASSLWLDGQPAKESYHEKLLRLAPIGNTVYQPSEFDANAEPLDESATLDVLAKEVAHWAEVVKLIDADQDDDDIRHDLYVRECLHGTLNGLEKQDIAIPAALLQVLEDADQHFIKNSVEDSPNGSTPLVDDVFWYRSRWPRGQR